MSESIPAETQLEWGRVAVELADSRPPRRVFFRVWKTGFPALCAYGATLDDAIVSLLNKHGEF